MGKVPFARLCMSKDMKIFPYFTLDLIELLVITFMVTPKYLNYSQNDERNQYL